MLKDGDIINYGDYRLLHSYIVMKNKLVKSDTNDGYIRIPLIPYVPNPKEFYSSIEDKVKSIQLPPLTDPTLNSILSELPQKVKGKLLKKTTTFFYIPSQGNLRIVHGDEIHDFSYSNVEPYEIEDVFEVAPAPKKQKDTVKVKVMTKWIIYTRDSETDYMAPKTDKAAFQKLIPSKKWKNTAAKQELHLEGPKSELSALYDNVRDAQYT